MSRICKCFRCGCEISSKDTVAILVFRPGVPDAFCIDKELRDLCFSYWNKVDDIMKEGKHNDNQRSTAN